MIVTRAPMRISFAGGGSDLPAFCNEEQGAVLGVAIRQYVYITLNRRFDASIRVGYSRTEIVDHLDDLQHDIAREALRYYGVDSAIEVTSVADVPAGTGLGSSAAYTAALCLALAEHTQDPETDIAPVACHIEIDRCARHCGRQDQYLSALGGCKLLTFEGERVGVETLPLSDTLDALQARLMLLYVGASHNAAEILARQQASLCARTRQYTRMLVGLARDMREMVVSGNLSDFGAALDQGWRLKRELADGITSPAIDEAYRVARAAGAQGGKLCGAGGGGFLLLYAEPEQRAAVRQALGLRELPVVFASNGAKVVWHG